MWAHIEVVTPPAEEPVTTEELREHAKVAPDVPDEQLAFWITAARQRCEAFTRRSLMTQTLDVWYDTMDGIGIIDDFPRGNVQSIVEVAAYEGYGSTATVVDSSSYLLASRTLIFNALVTFRYPRGLRVRIISGYGDDPEDVPADLRLGILELAAHYYEHRLGEGPGAKYEVQASGGAIPQGVADKWRSHQIVMV